MTGKVDVAIIGAGPAGMAAARALQARSLRVMVLDERAGPGGNVYAAALDHPPGSAVLLGRGYAKGARVARAFAQSGVPVVYGASVSRIEGDSVHYVQNGRLQQITATRLVLATGAIERPVPFPGWHLPGVMGAGAFQLLVKQSRVVAAGGFVLCGNGPLFLLVACQLETNAVHSPARVGLAHLPTLARNIGSAAKGLSYMAQLRLAGVSVISGVTRLEALGGDTLQSVRYWRRNGGPTVLDASMLLINEGVIPGTQLSLALDCRHRWDTDQHCLVPETDEWGETSRSGTFIIGDAAGILGADAAPHSAMLAALRIAEQLGHRPEAGAAAIARRALNRAHGFRRFLDAAYRPGLALGAPVADEVMICRCEQVTAGTLRAAVRDGARGPAQAKVFTRCGMGLCQGRICGNAVTRLIAAETGLDAGAVGGHHIRFPLKPLSLAELAGDTLQREQADVLGA
jgi:NADPH-dependent 2,4-dienoyl-CoA reductase/sulfur reductase-like enzyme